MDVSLFGSLWVSFSLSQYQCGSVSIRVGDSLGHIWLVAVGVSISFGQSQYGFSLFGSLWVSFSLGQY